jgi:uncharacterized protein (DUF1330 family)
MDKTPNMFYTYMNKMGCVKKEIRMTAILVSRIQVRDPEKMKAYSAAAAPTAASHGGEVVARGQFADALLGEGLPHMTGILRFPTVEAARNWFASTEYQALSDLREAAGAMEFYLYQSL